VRELENCVERMVVLARRRLLMLEDLPLPVHALTEDAAETARPARATPRAAPTPLSLRELERQQILQALERAGGVQAHAASLLGISARQLAYRLRKHGIVRNFGLTDSTTRIA
jgi:transcriptional regulator with GAF, ATPase, and Fis domain